MTLETTINIENMVCHGCAEKITDILLLEVNGVKRVKTKLMKKTVWVEFNAQETTESKIRAVLTEKGYLPTAS